MLLTHNESGHLEDVEEVQVVAKIQKKHFKKGEFYVQSFALDDLIMERKYTSYELKTLIALKRRIDYNNRIKTFRQASIAKEIGSSQPRVSNALKRLESDGIIRYDGLDYYFTDTYIKYAGDANLKHKKQGKH